MNNDTVFEKVNGRFKGVGVIESKIEEQSFGWKKVMATFFTSVSTFFLRFVCKIEELKEMSKGGSLWKREYVAQIKSQKKGTFKLFDNEGFQGLFLRT